MVRVDALNVPKTVPTVSMDLTAPNVTMVSTSPLVSALHALSRVASPATAVTIVLTVSSPCGKTPAPVRSAPHPVSNVQPQPQPAKAVSLGTTLPAPIATPAQVF